jgi:acyl transferase domain-containing protein
MFDARFFNFDPVDASIIDPQQRIFLECAWEALEFSGNTPVKNNSKNISVFAGMADSSYLQDNLLKSSWFNQNHDLLNARIATSIGTLSTQVSYRLNLNGKSININTACSTSLVAVEQACQDLILGYSDIALAGGVSIDVGKDKGYYYKPGGIVSKDGKCRPFDKNASGTVFSDGAGVVVLKRLNDAIKDNDTIYAVIKGCGINNDGADKLGYTAPSTNGQIFCINKALNQSRVSVEDISLLEAHGTATELGDVIEFKALNEVYKQYTNKKKYCVLGAGKGNIGHTDIAAGAAGLIKTVLCLYYKKIPPTLYFNQPNSNINLSDSPFYINDKLLEWDSKETPRFAGLSSFGIGGTNAHMVLSEYKQPPSQPSILQNKLVILSAKTKKALEQNTNEFIVFLNESFSNNNPLTYLHDLAYTLQTGRDDFQYRRIAIGKTQQEIINNLSKSFIYSYNFGEPSPIVFMFSGQGTQYRGMAMQLFDTIDYFSSVVIECSRIAKNYLGCDITAIICNDDHIINQTQYTQPALFIIEYALAKLLMYYGITPDALIGHSNGEYVAACIAKVFSLDDAIKLICQRGKLMSNAPSGAMLSIECTMEEFSNLKSNILVDLALHNSKNNCVASGTSEAIQKLQNILDKNNINYQKLKVSHAFHSYLMESVCQQFHDCFADIVMSSPQIPIISNLTGNWLTLHEATDPNYWVQHLRKTVQFKNGIETLVKVGYKCFVEIGPGSSLSSFTNEITHNVDQRYCITNILPNYKRFTSDEYQLLTGIGKLWQYGTKINWSAFYSKERRIHIALPTYSFQRQRYWIDPDPNQIVVNSKKLEISNWFYQPTWIRKYSYDVLADSLQEVKDYIWIIFCDKNGLKKEIVSKLRKHKAKLIIVEEGNDYSQINSETYTICPSEKSHYINLFKALESHLNIPILILHLFSYSEQNINNQILSDQHMNLIINNALGSSFYSLLYLTQAFIEVMGTDHYFKCAIVTNGSQQVLGTDSINPINASLTGISRVVPQEHSLLKFKLIDLEFGSKDKYFSSTIISACLYDEWDKVNPIFALRNNYLWQLIYSPIKLKQVTNRIKNNGVYLLTGGLGGINLTLSEIIAKTTTAPVLILLSRTEFPPRANWEVILKDDKLINHYNIY